MIIWLSGPYGVGKSTLAEALATKIENAMIFDAEEVGNAVRENYPGAPYGVIYEDYPLWCEFVYLLLKDLHNTFPRNILVPMTLVRQNSYTQLIQRLRDAQIDTHFIILEGSHACIHDRILARGETEDCWCMQNIDMSSNASKTITGGHHIWTDGKSVEELATLVQNHIAQASPWHGMEFRHARPAEKDTIYALYRSVLGRPFCVWNGQYPGIPELRQDLQTGNLYVLTDGPRMVGAVSVVPENELDQLDCWTCRDGTQRELARVVIAPQFQGRGLAGEMVRRICSLLYGQGCSAIHLSVAKSNLPALKTYQNLGFTIRGEAQLYGGSYYLMEQPCRRDDDENKANSCGSL